MVFHILFSPSTSGHACYQFRRDSSSVGRGRRAARSWGTLWAGGPQAPGTQSTLVVSRDPQEGVLGVGSSKMATGLEPTAQSWGPHPEATALGTLGRGATEA